MRKTVDSLLGPPVPSARIIEKQTTSWVKKDFLMRIKVSRKEAKESAYWLKLISETNLLKNRTEGECLVQEASELVKILSSIAQRSSAKPGV